LGAATLSASRMKKIATINPTSMKPCSVSTPRCNDVQFFFIRTTSPAQQRKRLPVVVRHILHQNGVGRDRYNLILPLHNIAIRRKKHIIAV
jgi:hypothetical protein